MFCSSCGSSLVPGAMHCGNCGSATSAATPVIAGNDMSGGYGQSLPTPQNDFQQNPGYQYPPQPQYGKTTSGKAIASLVLSLLGLSLLGVIFGHLARGEIKRSQGQIDGDGMALAGLIIGWIGFALWSVFWVLVFAAASVADNYYY